MTPLQMAMVAATIANDGVVMRPYVVDRVVAPNGSIVVRTKPQDLGRAVKPETAKEVAEMMQAGGRGRHRHRREDLRAHGRGQDGHARRPEIAGLNTTWFICLRRARASRRWRSRSSSSSRTPPAARRQPRSPATSCRHCSRPRRTPNLCFRSFKANGLRRPPHRHALRRALPDHPEARLRRDGERLPRDGPGARTPRRDQDPRRPPRPRRAVRRAVPARGPERRRALAPEHRLDLRPRRLRRHLLHRDGARRRADAEGAARRARPVAARDRDRLHAPDPLGAPLRAPERDRAPRHQAAQRDRGRRGPGEGDGLRDRARRRREPDDRGRVDHRHRAVPLPRAGARRSGRPDVRPLLDRDRPLRAADRVGAVHRRDARRDRDEAPLAGARRLRPRTGRRCPATSTTSSSARSPRIPPTATTRPRRWTPISSGSPAGSASPPRRPRPRPRCSPAPRSARRRRRSAQAAPPSPTYTPGRYYEYDEPPRRRSVWPWLLAPAARRRRARRRLVRLPGVPVAAQPDEARGGARRQGRAGAAGGPADPRRRPEGADHPRAGRRGEARASSSSRIRNPATGPIAGISSRSASRRESRRRTSRMSSARAATRPSRTSSAPS